MRLTAYLLAMAGLALATGLITYQGFSTVFAALAVAGWGLAVVAVFHLIPMVFDTLAWAALFDGAAHPSLKRLTWMRWIREGVDNLLPVAQVGGELVGTRLLMLHGVAGSTAGASVVLDLTFAVLTQLVFTLIGLGLLVYVTGDGRLVGAVLSGVALGGIGIGGFIIVQRRGLFQVLVKWLSGIANGERWLNLVGGAARLDEAVKGLYRNRNALLACSIWQLLAWVVGAGEVWLALYFLGHPVTLVEALLLESLGQAVRSAAFAIPGSLGVQEGGYMLLGTLLGLSPETGLAVSLAKRVRELLLGIPALLNWQWLEGRRIWNGQAQNSQTARIDY